MTAIKEYLKGLKGQKLLTVASFAGSNLSQISVIIALHFQVKDFAFGITCFGNKEFVQESLETNQCYVNTA